MLPDATVFESSTVNDVALVYPVIVEVVSLAYVRVPRTKSFGNTVPAPVTVVPYWVILPVLDVETELLCAVTRSPVVVSV